MKAEKSLIVFQDKKIRRIWHAGKWFFSVVDIVHVLTDSPNPNNYWKVLKHREKQLVTICNQLKLPSADGKFYTTDCVNTENAFRLVQSIPSKKAEPFKRWLAKVGYERVQEIETPELAQDRMWNIYKAKGYSDEWIGKRVRGISIRQELTDEWDFRGVNGNEYAILTDEISKATFGKTTQEYKQYKKLTKENLRDHMNELELIFTMLGEKVTTKVTQKEDSQGFTECKETSRRGGKVAGQARELVENEIGERVVTDRNYTTTPEKVQRIAKSNILSKKRITNDKKF